MNAPVSVDRLDPSAAGFRGAMRQLAGGVCIITAGQGEDRSGMTVTSVSSLSIDPPTLVVCINRQSSTWPLLLRYRAFGVNVLRADQKDVGLRFSGHGGVTGSARFGNDPTIVLETGTPLLSDALAVVDCEVEDVISRHSHGIIVGRVRAARSAHGHGPLIYWQGEYRTEPGEPDR